MGLFSRKKKFKNFPPIGELMVSKLILEEKRKPSLIYREKRISSTDSGWRILSGCENQEYIDNPTNYKNYSPSAFLQKEPSIEKLLLEGVGSVFRQEHPDSGWCEIFDHELKDDYMTNYQMTDDWNLKINNLFEATKEDNGDLLFTTWDKSLRIAIWDEKGKTRQQFFDKQSSLIKNRDQTNSATLYTYDLSTDTIKKIGFEVQGEGPNSNYRIIHSLSFLDEEILQMDFYFKNPKGKEWALDTWRNINTNK